MRLILLLLLIPGLGIFSASAQEPHIDAPSAQELYLSGVKAFQNSNFQEASEFFRMAFAKAPDNKFVLFNWGLAAHKMDRLGLAVAVWRRALAIDPDFRLAARALAVIQPQLRPQEAFAGKGFYESFRERVLVQVTGHQLLAITALLLFVLGWLSIRYFGQRRRALSNEAPLPPFPSVAVTLAVIFSFALLTSFYKLYDFFQPRATVIAESTSVYSGPSDQSSSLFEIYEGFEVIMEKKRDNWRQVSYPGGLTGWVKAEVLFQTSGRQIW